MEFPDSSGSPYVPPSDESSESYETDVDSDYEQKQNAIRQEKIQGILENKNKETAKNVQKYKEKVKQAKDDMNDKINNGKEEYEKELKIIESEFNKYKQHILDDTERKLFALQSKKAKDAAKKLQLEREIAKIRQQAEMKRIVKYNEKIAADKKAKDLYDKTDQEAEYDYNADVIRATQAYELDAAQIEADAENLLKRNRSKLKWTKRQILKKEREERNKKIREIKNKRKEELEKLKGQHQMDEFTNKNEHKLRLDFYKEKYDDKLTIATQEYINESNAIRADYENKFDKIQEIKDDFRTEFEIEKFNLETSNLEAKEKYHKTLALGQKVLESETQAALVLEAQDKARIKQNALDRLELLRIRKQKQQKKLALERQKIKESRVAKTKFEDKKKELKTQYDNQVATLKKLYEDGQKARLEKMNKDIADQGFDERLFVQRAKIARLRQQRLNPDAAPASPRKQPVIARLPHSPDRDNVGRVPYPSKYERNKIVADSMDELQYSTDEWIAPRYIISDLFYALVGSALDSGIDLHREITIEWFEDYPELKDIKNKPTVVRMFGKMTDTLANKSAASFQGRSGEEIIQTLVDKTHYIKILGPRNYLLVKRPAGYEAGYDNYFEPYGDADDDDDDDDADDDEESIEYVVAGADDAVQPADQPNDPQYGVDGAQYADVDLIDDAGIVPQPISATDLAQLEDLEDLGHDDVGLDLLDKLEREHDDDVERQAKQGLEEARKKKEKEIAEQKRIDDEELKKIQDLNAERNKLLQQHYTSSDDDKDDEKDVTTDFRPFGRQRTVSVSKDISKYTVQEYFTANPSYGGLRLGESINKAWVTDHVRRQKDNVFFENLIKLMMKARNNNQAVTFSKYDIDVIIDMIKQGCLEATMYGPINYILEKVSGAPVYVNKRERAARAAAQASGPKPLTMQTVVQGLAQGTDLTVGTIQIGDLPAKDVIEISTGPMVKGDPIEEKKISDVYDDTRLQIAIQKSLKPSLSPEASKKLEILKKYNLDIKHYLSSDFNPIIDWDTSQKAKVHNDDLENLNFDSFKRTVVKFETIEENNKSLNEIYDDLLEKAYNPTGDSLLDDFSDLYSEAVFIIDQEWNLQTKLRELYETYVTVLYSYLVRLYKFTLHDELKGHPLAKELRKTLEYFYNLYHQHDDDCLIVYARYINLDKFYKEVNVRYKKIGALFLQKSVPHDLVLKGVFDLLLFIKSHRALGYVPTLRFILKEIVPVQELSHLLRTWPNIAETEAQNLRKLSKEQLKIYGENIVSTLVKKKIAKLKPNKFIDSVRGFTKLKIKQRMLEMKKIMKNVTSQHKKDAIEKIKSDYLAKITKLKGDHIKEMNDIKLEHEDDVFKIKKILSDRETIKSDYFYKIEKLKFDYREEMRNIKSAYDKGVRSSAKEREKFIIGHKINHIVTYTFKGVMLHDVGFNAIQNKLYSNIVKFNVKNMDKEIKKFMSMYNGTVLLFLKKSITLMEKSRENITDYTTEGVVWKTRVLDKVDLIFPKMNEIEKTLIPLKKYLTNVPKHINNLANTRTKELLKFNNMHKLRLNFMNKLNNTSEYLNLLDRQKKEIMRDLKKHVERLNHNNKKWDQKYSSFREGDLKFVQQVVKCIKGIQDLIKKKKKITKKNISIAKIDGFLIKMNEVYKDLKIINKLYAPYKTRHDDYDIVNKDFLFQT